MALSVMAKQVANQPVVELRTGQARAEIWPSRGFNCLRWQILKNDGEWGDILYSAPDWVENPVPTRSGHPILFPFPNRLAHGRMTYEGRSFQLPLTESTKTHSIHGFTPRVPWDIVGTGMTHDFAFVTARFRMAKIITDSNTLWPGNAELTLTYYLSDSCLTVDALVENKSASSMPYGLGYHGYFRHPLAASDDRIDSCHYSSPVSQIWDCETNIPIGTLSQIPAELDFRKGKQIGSTDFDSLMTGFRFDSDFTTVGSLTHPDHPGELLIQADQSFPHLVVFTPPHRRAIAIEPYTCATNAANLSELLPHGWRTLGPHAKFQHTIRYLWHYPPK